MDTHHHAPYNVVAHAAHCKFADSPMPRVAITAGTTPRWDENGANYVPYRNAVLAAGLEPVRVSPNAFDTADSRSVSAFLRSIDGILLSGGPDVCPHYYKPGIAGRELEEYVRRHGIQSDPPRDELELALVHCAADSGIPVLAICRGIQLLNVALGGELIPDIRSSIRHRADGEDGSSALHPITLRRGTVLSDILDSGEEHCVNSRHHQGFTEAQAAASLRISAVAPDGIVEAVELVGGPWVLGVQWHPERPEDAQVFARDRAIFSAFAAQVMRRRESNV